MGNWMDMDTKLAPRGPQAAARVNESHSYPKCAVVSREQNVRQPVKRSWCVSFMPTTKYLLTTVYWDVCCLSCC